MEKISVQSSYTQVSLYARLSVPAGKPQDGVPKLKADDGGSGAKTADPEGLVARSADGDTVTLSIEARAVLVKEKVTVETGGGGRDACEGGPGRHRRGHGHFPRLSDADDLASMLLDDWNQGHAQAGGSRSDYADALRRRLQGWKDRNPPVSQRASVEYESFREEVSIKVTASLDSWAAAGAPAPGPAEPAAAAAPSGPVPMPATPQAPEVPTRSADAKAA